MFGSFTELSVPLAVGRMAPLAPPLLPTCGLTSHLTKSTASGGAFLPIANPSPPPKYSLGWLLPPATVGNGNHPRFARRPFFFLALASKVNGAHWPIRSIAARPLAIVAASPPAPSHGAARKPGWNGLRSMSRLSCLPASTNPGCVNSEPSVAALAIASLPAMRSDRLAHQNIPGHLSFSPTASGVMPACLSFCTSARKSSHVPGGEEMPAFLKSVLLYQTPTTPRLYGTPYCLPSIW